MVENRVGPPVRGKDFYGRERFVDLAAAKLKAGYVLLAAPRRFGKTSVMYNLMDQPRWDYQVVHADLEHFIELSELITKLIEQLASDGKFARFLEGLSYLPKQLWSAFRNAVEEIELYEVRLKLKEQIHPRWQESGAELFRRVAASPTALIVILDECLMMIDRMARSEAHRQEAETLLRWLRALRLSLENRNVHFLIAGSIGIGRVLNQLGEIKSINDFEQMRLEPFAPRVATTFLEQLAQANHLPLSPVCTAKMLALIGTPVLYFLQIIFSEVAKAYALRLWYASEEMEAESTRLATKFHEHTSANLLREARDVLEHHHYLAEATGSGASERTMALAITGTKRAVESKNFEEGLYYLDKALEIKPEISGIWNERGIALMNLGRHKEAITSYDRALAIKPDWVTTWHNRGAALGHLGCYEEALVSFDRALALTPDADIWYNRGIVLGELGRYEEALVSYDHALILAPDLVITHHNRGSVLGHLGLYEEALASYDQALTLMQDYALAWYNRGIALGELGRYEEALASFDRVLTLTPNSADAWYNSGITYLQLFITIY